VYVVHNIKNLFSLNTVQSVHTSFVQTVSGLTTVYEVDKAYVVLTLIAFNTVPFRSYTLRPTILPLLETFGNSSSGMSNSAFVEFCFTSSVASSWFPFRTFTLAMGYGDFRTSVAKSRRRATEISVFPFGCMEQGVGFVMC